MVGPLTVCLDLGQAFTCTICDSDARCSPTTDCKDRVTFWPQHTHPCVNNALNSNRRIFLSLPYFGFCNSVSILPFPLQRFPLARACILVDLLMFIRNFNSHLDYAKTTIFRKNNLLSGREVVGSITMIILSVIYIFKIANHMGVMLDFNIRCNPNVNGNLHLQWLCYRPVTSA